MLQDLTINTPLPLLGPHIPTLVLSFLGFRAVQGATHQVGPKILSGKWGQYDTRTRRGFATKIASMVHACMAIPLAFVSLRSKTLQDDPVFGYDPFVGRALAFSAAYFLWDTIDSLRNGTAAFIFHGAASLVVYLSTLSPFMAGHGPAFLLWEISTPFLNVHWLMDKTGASKTHPSVFMLNSLCFALAFFAARICYGGYISIGFINTLRAEHERISLHLRVVYTAGNIAMNGLNWFWFSKIFGQVLSKLGMTSSPSINARTAQSMNTGTHTPQMGLSTRKDL